MPSMPCVEKITACLIPKTYPRGCMSPAMLDASCPAEN